MNNLQYKSLAKLLFAIVLVAGLSACYYHDPYYDDTYQADPDIVVASVSFEDETLTRPARIILELENIGYGDVYRINGHVTLYFGNAVYDSADYYISALRQGASRVVVLEFDRVARHSEYDTYAIDMYGEDEWGYTWWF